MVEAAGVEFDMWAVMNRDKIKFCTFFVPFCAVCMHTQNVHSVNVVKNQCLMCTRKKRGLEAGGENTL